MKISKVHIENFLSIKNWIPYTVVVDNDIKDLSEITDEVKRQRIQRENENH